jgi:DNA-binding IclR family transcriptional regulator
MARFVADSGLREHARALMAALRDQTGESVHLAAREAADVVIIEVEESTSPTKIYWPAGDFAPYAMQPRTARHCWPFSITPNSM